MNRKLTYRIIGRMFWLLAAAILMVFVFGAMRSRTNDQCSAVIITESGNTVDSSKQREVFHVISEYVDKSITKMTAHDIPLNKLEEVLVKEEWIDDASLYIDNTNALHIDLNSRKPIARIFDKQGSNYYLDLKGEVFTVFNIKQNDLVLFTGVPVIKAKDSAANKVLLHDLVTISNAVAADSFWMVQTDQVEYTPQGYKLHPVLGNHVVWLGGSNDMPVKLERLKLFYKQVLSQTGLHAFPVINVAYKGQVVVQHDIHATTVSGEQLNKNIEKMVDRNKHIAAETAIESKVTAGRLLDAKPVQLQDAKNDLPAAKATQQPEPIPKARMPKALMPKTNNN